MTRFGKTAKKWFIKELAPKNTTILKSKPYSILLQSYEYIHVNADPWHTCIAKSCETKINALMVNLENELAYA